MRRKPDNVVPLHDQRGRWKPLNLLVAFLTLAVFFGGIAAVVVQAERCDRRGGVLARGVVWFVCVKQ